MTAPHKLPAPTSWTGIFITQAIAIIGFVVVPVLITLMAPVTTLELRKADGGVEAQVTRYVLLVVPWRSQIVRNVTSIRADVTEEFRYKNTRENRRMDRVGHTNLATGQVALIGDGPEVIVQAQPGLAEELSAEYVAFAAASSQTPVRRTVYASWALTYILGGVMTALFALYAVGAALATLNFLRKQIAK